MAEALNPLAEYDARQARWRAREALQRKRFIRIGNWRLTVALTAAALGWLAFARGLLSGWWLLVPAAVFIALFIWHQRVIRKRTLAERALRYYDFNLARLRNEWVGAGNSGTRFQDSSHVYADDLDVFGRGSLFELLSTARTAAGEDTLAVWLLRPASRDEALDRQEAVRELREKLDLREDLALLGEDVGAGIHADVVAKWGNSAPVHFAAVLRPLALGLAIAGTAALLAFLADWLPLWPFLTILAGDFLLIFALRKAVKSVWEALETPARDLAILALLIERLERESFAGPRLKQLHSRLEAAGLPASRRIARFERWMDLVDSGDHILLRVLGPVLLWRQQLAMAVEAWRRESGPHIGLWIQALAEFEALSALASLAFERPDWTFPELLDGEQARFEAQSIKHPLMPAAKCIQNDVTLHGQLRLLIVSGSNMSGKSTLLRTIGLNTVLAWAGAPVAAASLRLSPLHAGASIRATDSLQDNRSRFLAEITRLRQIVDLTKNAQPVLFLLDELLGGTNSHDRRIGASGLVRGLLRANSIGLLTTHDLALAQIEQDAAPLAANMHFEDRIEGGRIEFDYRLRPGVVTHSNALELMRAVGLEV